jgi:hypothetical protein
MALDHRPSCDFCGAVVGVYEPLVWLHAGVAIVTSRAADPGLSSPDHEGMLYHRDCYGQHTEAVAAASTVRQAS